MHFYLLAFLTPFPLFLVLPASPMFTKAHYNLPLSAPSLIPLSHSSFFTTFPLPLSVTGLHSIRPFLTGQILQLMPSFLQPLPSAHRLLYPQPLPSVSQILQLMPSFLQTLPSAHRLLYPQPLPSVSLTLYFMLSHESFSIAIWRWRTDLHIKFGQILPKRLNPESHRFSFRRRQRRRRR